MANLSWTGLGANALVTNGDNWTPIQAPIAGDNLSFAGGYDPLIEFESIIFGEENYFVPKADSQFKRAGISAGNPTTKDMKGNDYYYNNDLSEYQPPIGGFIALAADEVTGHNRAMAILRLTKRQTKLTRFRNPRINILGR